MRAVHVIRKPVEGPIADNVLEHGSAGFNIDACRIAFSSQDDADRHAAEWDRDWNTSPIHWFDSHIGNHPGEKRSKGGGVNVMPGRWPANVILQHFSSCEYVGTKRVKGTDGYRVNPVAKQSDGKIPLTTKPVGYMKGSYTEPNGDEPVADWRCARGCPVVGLDSDSGDCPSGPPRINRRGATTGTSIGGKGVYGTGAPQIVETGYGDSGGASRFFRQVR